MPATQGKRFVEYLHSTDAVPVFDKNHAQIGELSKADLRHVTICAVTLDPFTELAAQVQHLRKMGVDVGPHPVWAISLDDLRVYADIFDNPLLFLHYVEQRMRAFQSDIVQSDDELDHLGLYLKHNHYSQYAEELQGQSAAKITFDRTLSKLTREDIALILHAAYISGSVQTAPFGVLSSGIDDPHCPAVRRCSAFLL